MNPFVLGNDKEDKVKKVLIDETLKQFDFVGVHPLENDSTVEISLKDLNEHFLKPSNKEVVYLNLSDEGIILLYGRISTRDASRGKKGIACFSII